MHVHIHIHIDLDDRTTEPSHQPALNTPEVAAFYDAYHRVLRTVRSEHGDDLADVLEFIHASGLRLPEVLALRWSDIDMGGRTVRIERSVDGGAHGPIERLSKCPRVVRLDERSIRVLRRLASRARGVHVLGDRSGRPYTRERMVCIWRRACRTAGVSLRLHDLRRLSPRRSVA